MAEVTICGLGPGGLDQITEATRRVLTGSDPVLLRTARHPSAVLAEGASSFDEVYEQAESFDDVYRTIADAVVDVARTSGRAVYAVPGSPLILERSVRQIRAATDVDVTLLPAISFLDEVWARLQIDPVDDAVRMIDGLRFATEAAGERGPLLVAHAHADWVLSDIKLALDVGPEQNVIVLQRLGTPEERIFEVAWPELDRAVEADHLTTLYLPEMAAPVGHQLARSVEMMHRLRNNCPWDREQSHESLRKYLIEESYEVLDAIEAVAAAEGDDGTTDLGAAYADLEEELGDLCFQILFHAELAAEAGQFTIAEVAEGLTDKMIRRHPHVYEGDGAIDGSTAANWELLKQQEKQRGSVLDGIPTSLPALALTEKTLKKVAGTGTATELDALGRSLGEYVPDGTTAEDVGLVLMTIVELARRQGINAEEALRAILRRAAERFRSAEARGAVDERWIVG